MRTNYYHGKKVLVTGAAGFIGSHLLERLVRDGAEVIAYDNLQAGSWETLDATGCRYTKVQADVRDYSAVEAVITTHRPQIIFHLAANASVPLSVTDPRTDFESNCCGTFVLLETLRKLAPETRVVFASSAAVYGEPGHEKITEKTPLRPISPYGASKLAAEEQCRMFTRVYGVPTVIARLFNCYGPRMLRFVILDFLKKLNLTPDRLEILGDGKQTRDFTFVSDTVAGLVLLGERGTPGEAYNVASGDSTSVIEVAEELIDVLGKSNTTSLSFTGNSWKGDAQFWRVDIVKLKEIGYSPFVDLRTGLEHVTEWFSESEK